MTIDLAEIKNVKQRFEIVGNSPLLNRAIEIGIKVATTDLSVLITGESGVGKEAFSKVIHHLSKRRHNPFIAINCGAIPEGTIDSELFGHEKGAFTSAHEMRKGYFETVNGGTIFLDEIGELPLGTQSRLLRVLESGEFIKVGSSKVQKTDVRIIAATNKDLLERISKNKFREDLFYRLSTVTIKIPPLRERKEDIMLLIAKFATDFSDKHNIPPIEFDPGAEGIIKEYSWPGNIRQLKNFVEEVSVLETERFITAPDVIRYLPPEPKKELIQFPDSRSGSTEGFQERELIYKFLFDLRQDVQDMKTMMYRMFSNMNASSAESRSPIYQRLLKAGTPPQEITEILSHAKNEDNGFSETEEVDHEESLSLQDQEKEMIRRALQKHNGKRKAAAKELGISERTLYRKIKDYELEDV